VNTLLTRVTAAVATAAGQTSILNAITAVPAGVWAALTSGMTTVGSIGKKLADWVVGTLTTTERTAIANEVENQIIDDTDSEKVLTAITDKIASVNPSLGDLTLAAIASANRTEMDANSTKLAAIATDAATAATQSTAAATSAASADAKLSEARLGKLDSMTFTIAGKLDSTAYTVATGGITATSIAAAALNGKGDWLLAAGYTAPDNAGITALATTLTDIQGAGWVTGDNLHQLRTDISNVSGGGGGGSAVGTGADLCTITITDSGTNLPIADADVWITSDSAGTAVIAGTLQTNSNGQATFLLDAGTTVYLWMQKDGENSILGDPFVVVAD
jgi:hypothetical protein